MQINESFSPHDAGCLVNGADEIEAPGRITSAGMEEVA